MCYAQTISCSSKKEKVFLYVPLNCLTPPLLLKPTTNLWAVVDSPLDSFSPLEEEGKLERESRSAWCCGSLRPEVVTWVASSILYFTEGETQPRREKGDVVSMVDQGNPSGSADKESTRNAGDPVSIPGSERSPGRGNGNPLQYSCLGNPTDRGAWWATVHGLPRLRHNGATEHTHIRVSRKFRDISFCLFVYLLDA